MALPPSTANWHWKNKNVTPWAKEWLQTELTKLSVSGDNGESVSIAEVTSVEGDVELGQRKSKLLTIFDCDVRARWTGTTSSGTQVEGTLRIPEISHEIICDQLEDYRYEWSLKTASSAEVDAVYKLARSRLPAALEAKLATFPSTIVEVHGKDVYIGGTASGQSTPPVVSAAPTSTAAPSASAAPAKAASAPVKKSAKPANTSTITVEASFQASADDLFGLLTDEKRIPAWTRNSAVSQAKPETQYSLFGGGVKGTYVSLTPGKEIIQTWALQSPTWPQGHEATLTIAFDQSTDSTKVTFTLTGVPTGMEDELRRNIEGYYVHGFKSIGYVAFTPAEPVYSSDYLRKRQSQTKTRPAQKAADTTPSLYLPAAIIGTLVIAAAFAIPYLSSSSLPRPGSA